MLAMLSDQRDRAPDGHGLLSLPQGDEEAKLGASRRWAPRNLQERAKAAMSPAVSWLTSGQAIAKISVPCIVPII